MRFHKTVILYSFSADESGGLWIARVVGDNRKRPDRRPGLPQSSIRPSGGPPILLLSNDGTEHRTFRHACRHRCAQPLWVIPVLESEQEEVHFQPVSVMGAFDATSAQLPRRRATGRQCDAVRLGEPLELEKPFGTAGALIAQVVASDTRDRLKFASAVHNPDDLRQLKDDLITSSDCSSEVPGTNLCSWITFAVYILRSRRRSVSAQRFIVIDLALITRTTCRATFMY